MNRFMLLCILLLHLKADAQTVKGKPTQLYFTESEKYITFSPLALAEPHLAVGLGFGNRFSERSEYFAELSYVAKQPLYGNSLQESLHGIRFISQYRYHFLQRWRPLINFGNAVRKKKASRHPFMGVEFRIKPFNFSATGKFIKNSPADTLDHFLYRANAVSIGGALLFGETYDLSSDGRWKLELTLGIGGKVKMVHYKNIPAGYEPYIQEHAFGLAVPAFNEAIGVPYFPCAFRLRYVMN